MEKLGRYQLKTSLSNKNAGSCQWCFATLNGQDYFIKEFLEPKYPAKDTTSTPEKIARKIKKCEEFERNKTRIYNAINSNSDGNAVRITDFFRQGARYYMVMPRIVPAKLEVEDIARLNMYIKRRLCAIIAHSLAQIHKANYVHADIKHSNIIMTYSKSKQLTAKLIDYDAGYFETNPPRCPDEIAGDQVYFSPEAWGFMMEENVRLTCKLDIFALGVLFHQYLTGSVPHFDMSRYVCLGEAVHDGGTVAISGALPADLQELIWRMLQKDPARRPTASQIHEILIAPQRVVDNTPPRVVDDNGWFHPIT